MIETTWSDLVVASALKGAAVLVLAAVVARLLRRQPAATRHAVWLAALVAQLLIPVLGATLPAWQVPLPAWAAELLPAHEPGAGPMMATAPEPRAADAALPVSHEVAAGAPAAREEMAAPRPAPAEPAAASPLAGIRGWSTRTTLLAVWAVGAGVILLRLVLGVGAVAVLARRARRVKDGRWLVLATELSEEMGLARPVILLRGGPLSVPVTWGILVPAVLLPADADEWPEDRRRAVLLHELAHVRRHDAFAQLLAYLVLAACWFNPLVWLAVRSMRAESERACDDCVLRHGTEPSAYVQDLLAIVRSARNRKTPPALAALAMARPSEFEGRVLAILDGSTSRRGAGRLAKLVTAATVVALVAPLAALRPAAAVTVSPSDEWVVREALGAPPVQPPQPPQPPQPMQPMPEWQPSQQAALLQPPARGVGLPMPTPTPTPTPAPTPMPDPKWHGYDFDGWGKMAGDLASSISRSVSQSVSRSVSASVSANVGKVWTNVNPKVNLSNVSVNVGKGGRGSRSSAESEAAVPGLIAALSDSDGEVRLAAVQALGQLEDPRAVEALTQALRRDADPSVRATAAWALGQIESHAAVAALSEAVREDRDAKVRSQAAWALGQIEDAAAVSALGAAVRDPDATVRRQAIWALGQIEAPSAVPALITALSAEDVESRRQAAWALGQIESRDATAALGTALRDRDAGVRSQAAWALGQIEDPGAVTALSGALRDSAASVRRQAAWALGQIESPSAVPALTAALRDADRSVRKTSAWALAQIEDPAAVPGLVEMSRVEDVELRRAAVHALAQIRGAAAMEALLALLKDPDPEVRRHAARALGNR